VNLTGVTNAQRLTVTLFGVTDGVNTADMPLTFSVLAGDTNDSEAVNSGDVIQTRSRSGEETGASNFRNDVNADGIINSGDTLAIRNRSGTALTSGEPALESAATEKQ
jgi:hypothetical protein